MALTMTRTRTQTALTKLVDLLARVNGELDFVRELQVEVPGHREGLAAREAQLARVNGELDFVRELQREAPGHREGLAAREAQLLSQRQALMLTIRQFDPELDPEEVGSDADWWPSRRPKTWAGMARRYLADLYKIESRAPSESVTERHGCPTSL